MWIATSHKPTNTILARITTEYADPELDSYLTQEPTGESPRHTYPPLGVRP